MKRIKLILNNYKNYDKCLILFFFVTLFIGTFIRTSFCELSTSSLDHVTTTQGHVATSPAIRRPSSQGQYCGIYCIYTAARMFGKSMDVQDLLSPDFIGSSQGSSIAELEKAAKSQGLYASPIVNLSAFSLKQADCPVILHMRRGLETEIYDHYALFLGTRNGKAIIFDPPIVLTEMPFPQVAARFDGVGLAVSDKLIDNRMITISVCVRVCIYLISSAVVVLLVRRPYNLLARRMLTYRRWKIVTVEAFVIMAMATIGGGLWSTVSAEGLLSDREVISSLEAANVGKLLPKISVMELNQKMSHGAIVIDSRLSSDFNVGHIPNALNIPVNVSEREMLRRLPQVSQNIEIVVYCQNASCPFSEKVASRLFAAGYTNLTIFKGGWEDWVAEHSEVRK